MDSTRRRRRTGRLSSIFFVLTLLSTMAIGAQESFQGAAEVGIADGYLEQARVLLQDGGGESALELLETSLEFFPGYSESAYLSAQVYLQEQETTWKAIGYFETALEAGTWTQTDPLTAAVSPDRIAERTEGYTGVRIRDANRDGYYEQRYQYREGILTGWTADADQNGIAEISVEFEDGTPNAVRLGGGPDSTQLVYRYSEYPFLESASFVSGNSRRDYSIVPYLFRRPVFTDRSGERYGLQLCTDFRVEEAAIRRSAYRRAEYSGAAPFAECSVHLLEGRIVQVDELPDASGRYGRTVFYEASQPVEAVRDMDGDGTAEIRERFRGGSLWKISLDPDGDGVIEFEQVYESGVRRTYWDYDDDGSYDSREVVRSDGSLLRSFSSALNGTYDLTASRRQAR